MRIDNVSASNWPQRIGLFLLFLVFGLLIFVVFNHIQLRLPSSIDPVGRTAMIAGFLAVALLARKSHRFEKYWPVLFACFIASLATAVDYYLPSRDWLLKFLDIPIRTPAGIALDKLDSSIMIIVSVLLFTGISGNNLASICLRKGNLRKGIIIGSITFVVAAAGAIPVSNLFFGARDLTLEKVSSWTPWILIFIAGNAFNEELLFRGLFLKKFDPFVGELGSNLAIAIPFALHHSGVSYTSDTLMFLAILLPLALAWGYITQKTDSLWCSFKYP